MKKRVVLVLEVDDTCDEPHKMWSAEEEMIEKALESLDIVKSVDLTVTSWETDSMEIYFGE